MRQVRVVAGIVSVILTGAMAFASGCAEPAASSWRSGAGSSRAGLEPYKAERGPDSVRTREWMWTDRERGREVPVKAYLPRGADGPLPLLIFSHGGGGSREGGSYLGEHLASHGYAVVMPQHAGSDREALRGDDRGRRGRRRGGQRGGLRERLMSMVGDAENWAARPLDVTFVIDRALAGELGVEIDPGRIGVMGHSYGAFTAMAAAGMLVDLPGDADSSFLDQRVGAVVAFSPQGVGRFGIDEGAWAGIAAPLLMMTGTEDSGRERGGDWTWRREPFDAMRASGIEHPTALAVIEDATHMAFSDAAGGRLVRRMGGGDRDPRHHGWIVQLTTAWFDAHLGEPEHAGLDRAGSDRAGAWLGSEAIEDESGGEVRLERLDPGDR